MRCGEMMLKHGVETLKSRGRKMEFVAQRKAIPTNPTLWVGQSATIAATACKAAK